MPTYCGVDFGHLGETLVHLLAGGGNLEGGRNTGTLCMSSWQSTCTGDAVSKPATVFHIHIHHFMVCAKKLSTNINSGHHLSPPKELLGPMSLSNETLLPW